MTWHHPEDIELAGIEFPDEVRDLVSSAAPVSPFFTGCRTGLKVLSQWHRSDFVAEGRLYDCAEQYMMHSKAMLFKDHEMARRILDAASPHDHKRMGQNVTGFNEFVWERERCKIVFQGNLEKFSQNDGLRKRLLRTHGSILVEANAKDFIWGAGLHEDEPAILDPRSWRGQNLLGYILMCVRHRLAQM